MTDVNVAVELLKDAFQDAFDVAILISADSDLIAPLAAVRFPKAGDCRVPTRKVLRQGHQGRSRLFNIGHRSIQKANFLTKSVLPADTCFIAHHRGPEVQV